MADISNAFLNRESWDLFSRHGTMISTYDSRMGDSPHSTELAKVYRDRDGLCCASGRSQVLVRSEYLRAQQLALRRLGKAVQRLVKILKCCLPPRVRRGWPHWSKHLLSRRRIGPEKKLYRRLQEQLTFWQATAPTLFCRLVESGWTPHAPTP